MRLASVTIEGFRGIASLSLDFDSRLTVLVGENGTGKTTVLDALAILLDQYLARYVRASAQKATQLKETDRHRHVMGRSDESGVDNSYAYEIEDKMISLEVRIEVGVNDQDNSLSWIVRKPTRTGKIRGNEGPSQFDSLNTYVRRRAESRRSDFTGEPLLIYYGQRRAVLDVPQRLRDTADQRTIAAFSGALKTDLEFREFVAWFRDRSLDEAQHWRVNQAYRDRQLVAVRHAMTEKTGLSNPEYRTSLPRGLHITKKGVDLLVSQLSSGEQTFLALAGDLARRLAMLNPKLADPLQGPGIVMIDEIELHLHPRWQREILPWLTETFPGCQFVITTHSPQVLGRVHAESIRILRLNKAGQIEVGIPQAAYGRDSNEILLAVLGADERDAGIKASLDQLEDAIGAGRLPEAAALLEALRGEIEGEPPELTLAQARLERRRRTQTP